MILPKEISSKDQIEINNYGVHDIELDSTKAIMLQRREHTKVGTGIKKVSVWIPRSIIRIDSTENINPWKIKFKITIPKWIINKNPDYFEAMKIN